MKTIVKHLSKTLLTGWKVVSFGVLLFVLTGCSKQSKIEHHNKRGDSLYADGDYEKARIEYLNVTRLSPTNAHAFAQIGNIYYENGLVLRAGAFLSRAIELGENNARVRARRAVLISVGDRAKGTDEALKAIEQDPQQEEAILLLADLASDEEKTASLKARLSELRQVNGDQPIYDTAEAVVELKSRRIDEAEEILNAVTSEHGDFAPAHLILSSLYFSRSNLVAGEAALKRAAELSPPRSNRQIRYINLLLKKDKEAGLARIEEILKLAPDYVPARLRRAQIALADQDYETAKQEVNSIVSRDPNNIESRQLQAQMFLAMKELDKAQEIMAALVKMYPGAPQIWYQAAVTSIAKSDVERSFNEIEKAYALNPRLPHVVILRGRLLMAKGKLSEAIESIQQFVAESPKYAPGHLQLADAFMRSGQLDQALAVYKDFEKNFPTDPLGAFLQGMVFSRLENPAEARSAFDRTLIVAPTYFPAIERLGLLDIQEEAFDSAVGRVSSYLAANPDSAQGRYLLGSIHLAAKKYVDAEREFDAAAVQDPQMEKAYFALVQIYNETDRKTEAKGKLIELLAEKPTDNKALMTLGLLLNEENDYENAADRYETLITANPEFTPALNNLAYLYSEHLNDLDRAYVLARKARELLPDDPKVGDTLGWILYRRKEFSQAQVHLEESAAKLPDFWEVIYHLGMNHYQMGNASRATVLLEQAVKSAGDEEGWLNDAESSLAILNIDVSANNSSVLTQLEELIENRPNDVVLMTRLAQVQERLGRNDEAMQSYREASQLFPNAVDPLVGQARIFAKQGDAARALTFGRKAREASDDANVAYEVGQVAYIAKDFPYAYALLQNAISSRDARTEFQMAFTDAAIAVGQLGAAKDALDKVVLADGALRDEAELRLKSIAHATARTVDDTAIEVATNDTSLLGQFIAIRLLSADEKSNEAVAGYQDLLGEYPQFSPAMKQLAIELMRNPATISDAEKWARKARETMSSDAELSKVLGEAAFVKGDYIYAADILDSASKTLTEDAGLFLMLARSQAELKQVAQAKSSVNRALALPLSPEEQREAEAVSRVLSSQ